MSTSEQLVEATEQVESLKAKWNAGRRGRNRIAEELDFWIGRKAMLSVMVGK